jgi:hypothetical protein
MIGSGGIAVNGGLRRMRFASLPGLPGWCVENDLHCACAFYTHTHAGRPQLWCKWYPLQEGGGSHEPNVRANYLICDKNTTNIGFLAPPSHFQGEQGLGTPLRGTPFIADW